LKETRETGGASIPKERQMAESGEEEIEIERKQLNLF
jgi:hypothetical protein